MKSLNSSCDPKEVALKSFFLGPQAENATWVLELMRESFTRWVTWRKSLFPDDGDAISENDQASPEFMARRKNIESTLQELLTRFEKEVPKFSPRYLGHMFSEVSLPALIGHIVTLLHNPNNISGEVSRVGIALEDEAIQFLGGMVGFPDKKSSGHFTSGGTLANFEALVRARARAGQWLSVAASVNAKARGGKFDLFRDAHLGWERFNKLAPDATDAPNWNFADLNPWTSAKKIEDLYGGVFSGPVVLIPENKHYSWKKGCHLLGFGKNSLWPIQLDRNGRLSVSHLEKLIDRAALEKRPIALICSVVGATELGGIDPVHAVQRVVDSWKKSEGIHIWHHVDAAFGGFLCSLNRKDSKVLSSESALALEAVSRVDSVTLDPHKLGYVPYASGAFLARDKRDYYFESSGGAPYIDFDHESDKGPFTIEGSRSAAGAVATWMTARTLGLNPDGYGLLLERTLRIRKELSEKLQRAGLSVQVAPGGDTSVLCFACAEPGEKISQSNERTLRVYDAFSPKRNGPFIVSKTALQWSSYSSYLDEWSQKWSAEKDADELILIRMCIMNPFLGSVQTNVNYLDLFLQELEKLLKKPKKEKCEGCCGKCH